MGWGSIAPEQTHCWRCVLYVWRSTAICADTFRISERWNSSNFGETQRSLERKLPFLSNTPHFAYLRGLLLDFIRCERVNVTGNVFGNVTFSVKWCILDWIEMEATGLDFMSTFICPLNATDRNLQTRHQNERRGRLAASTAVKNKNYDVSSALNHGGFKDELSC